MWDQLAPGSKRFLIGLSLFCAVLSLVTAAMELVTWITAGRSESLWWAALLVLMAASIWLDSRVKLRQLNAAPNRTNATPAESPARGESPGNAGG
jgi:hypothetical protein